MLDPDSGATPTSAPMGTLPSGWYDRAVIGFAVAAGVMALVSLSLVQIALGGLVLLALPRFPRVWREQRGLCLALIAVFASWVISWLNAPWGMQAFRGIKDAWLLLIIPAGIAHRELLVRHRGTLARTIGVALVVTAAYMVLQIIAGRDLIRGEPLDNVFRANGFLGNAQSAAGALTLMTWFIACQAAMRERPRRARLAWGAIAIVGTVAILLTVSRAYLLGLPILALILAGALGWRWLLGAWLLGILLVGIALTIGLRSDYLRMTMPDLAFSSLSEAESEGENELEFYLTARVDSRLGSQRLAYWYLGIQLIGDHWVTGTGKGHKAFSEGFAPYRHRFYDQTGVKIRNQHLHNNVLEVVAETGLVGAMATGAFLLLLIWNTLGAYKRGAPRQAALIMTGFLVVFLIPGLLDCNLGDLEVTLPAAFLIGLVWSDVTAGPPAETPAEPS